MKVKQKTSKKTDAAPSSKLLSSRKFKIKEILVWGLKKVRCRDVIIMIFLSTVTCILSVVVPVIGGHIINLIIFGEDDGKVWKALLMLISGAAAEVLFQSVNAIILTHVARKADMAAEAAVWDKLLSLPVRFFREHNTSEHISQIDGIHEIGSKIIRFIVSLALETVLLLCSFAVLLYYNTVLTLLLTSIAAVLLSAVALTGKRRTRGSQEYRYKAARLRWLINQIISGLPLFHAERVVHMVFANWKSNYHSLIKLRYKVKHEQYKLLSFVPVIQLLTIALLFYLFGSSVRTSMSPGSFIAFIVIFINFLSVMISFSRLPANIGIILDAFEMVRPILDEKPETTGKEQMLESMNGEIEFCRVTFKYRNSDFPALNDVSLRIKANERVAIVGLTGSGKTSLVKVLLGIETPQSGSVFYNGHDIRNINLAALRRKMGIALQNGILVEDSILNNITGSDCSISEADAWSAAELAEAADFIRGLPEQMNTSTLDGGKALSHELRQKLLIAGAFAKRPEIFVFDEALSSIDKDSCLAIHNNVKKLNSAGIFITRSLDIAAQCERIIVMDNGKIVEDGTFEELKNLKGYFYKLFRL